MIGIVPYAGLDIAAFELMREKLHEKHGDRPPPHYLLIAGMLSSTGAQLVAYPLGLIRTRLQVCRRSAMQVSRRGTGHYIVVSDEHACMVHWTSLPAVQHSEKLQGPEVVLNSATKQH